MPSWKSVACMTATRKRRLDGFLGLLVLLAVPGVASAPLLPLLLLLLLLLLFDPRLRTMSDRYSGFNEGGTKG